MSDVTKNKTEADDMPIPSEKRDVNFTAKGLAYRMENIKQQEKQNSSRQANT